MMLRRCIYITKTAANHHRPRRHALNLSLRRLFFSSPNNENISNYTKHLRRIRYAGRLLPLPVLHRLGRHSLLTAGLISAAVAASFVVLSDDEELNEQQTTYKRMFEDFTIERSNESLKKILETVMHTSVAVSVLWKSLSSILSSANHEVRSGFEVRVAALLADIVAADESRRAAIVGAGGGLVVDWLLDMVAFNKGGNYGTQAESARALAYLIADSNFSEAVLRRPHAVPNLLRFIYSAHPHPSEQQVSPNPFEIADPLKGRSMLVAAIMDVVTSHCENVEQIKQKPILSKKAARRDISAALEVVKEGNAYLHEPPDIGVKVPVVGLSIKPGSNELEQLNVKSKKAFNKFSENSLTVIPGLWDDLHSQHVAVPFAAWALADWAMGSEINRSHIQEFDHDGHIIMNALVAPERSVKWHGSLLARYLLLDKKLKSDDFVPDWSSSLLSTVSQASKSDDVHLTRVALSAFLLSLEKCPGAPQAVMEKGLYLMRETSRRMKNHQSIQEALAKGLESLCSGNIRLSLEEGQKWSNILFRWVFDDTSSDITRSSAIKILSRVLEDYAPSSIPISQGWLAILLNDILKYRMASLKEIAQPKDKVKTQIDQANVVTGTQAANYLASAVVNLTVKQLATDSLQDLLSNEPFITAFKNRKKDGKSKINAADSALATLKGIKTMSENCSDDLICQKKVIDYGVVPLLRRLLLKDDYEKLAANEVYTNASSDMKINNDQVPESHDKSKIRVPPAAHIRRHAARFLTALSVHPKVKDLILNDHVLCDWLENCANGKIRGSTDLKTRSYARATLLNIYCNDNDSEKENKCPHFTQMIYLINPDLGHWKYPEEERREYGVEGTLDKSGSDAKLDVVFVHGLRGGPYKSWRLSECKDSSKSGLVEKIDEEAGKLGTFWPAEWLSADFPHARMFTVKYKTNLSQWSGSSLPLQEVSSMLLEKLLTAGIGDRPVVFVTHSMGGLVVKQMLHQARAENIDKFVNNTMGVVFYSSPHFGSKLADLPCRMGFVLRPAPTINELRSGSPRLIQLNDFIRRLHKKGALDVLSFCETKVTPIVEGYGGWAFRLEIVPIESSYPGYGKLVVLESTDHVNSCKPISKSDPSYRETLYLLHKLRAHIDKKTF